MRWPALLLLSCRLMQSEADFVPQDSADQTPSQPVVLPLSAPHPGCQRRLEVLGFSDNERAGAVLQHLTCHHPDGTIDTFGIVDLINLRTMAVLATFQASPILRQGANHKAMFALPSELRRDNPAWASAHPLHAWLKVKRAGHFNVKKHDFKDVMVRVRLDPDSKIDVEAKGVRLQILAPGRTPIGFEAMGRLVDGNEIALGHVREPAPCQKEPCGTIEVNFSRHGHLVALVHHGLLHDEITLTRTPPKQPIASTQVGFLQMIQWDADSVKSLFGDMHPEGKKIWNDMVGDIE